MSEQTAMQVMDPSKLNKVMRSEQIVGRFEDVVGKGNAGGYIASVLVAVSQNDDLQKCDTNSVIGSALRAATMKLSVDPAVAHAYLVPFKDHGTPKATFMVGYKGLQHMAIRSGKYRRLNLVSVYANDKIIEDRLTGDIEFVEKCESALELHNRHIGKDLPIGYLLYIELTNGYKKTFFMTCEECDAHGRKYSKNYFKWGTQEPNTASLWHKDPHAMYKKTVIRLGITKYGYLDPQDLANMGLLDESSDEQNYLNGIRIEEIKPGSIDQNMKELGFGDSQESSSQDQSDSVSSESDDANPSPSPETSAMTYEQAFNVAAGNGALYGNMTNEQLNGHKIGITKKLKTELSQKEQDELLNKLEAIKILTAIPDGQRLKMQGQPSLIQ